MERYKVGKVVDMSELTEESLTDAITTLTTDKSYQENIKRLSDIFRNNIADPLKSSVFWIEYVMKYKGAPHLKSAAINLEWYQYLMLDIFGVFFLALFAAIYLWIKIFKVACGLLCGRKNQNSEKKKTN